MPGSAESSSRRMRWEHRSARSIGGRPLLHVAVGGRGEDGRHHVGVARGVVAVGDVAVGLVALGGLAVGPLALGGLAVGLVALGGVALGLLAVAGVAIGLVAVGAVAIGLTATGPVTVSSLAATGRRAAPGQAPPAQQP